MRIVEIIYGGVDNQSGSFVLYTLLVYKVIERLRIVWKSLRCSELLKVLELKLNDVNLC